MMLQLKLSTLAGLVTTVLSLAGADAQVPSDAPVARPAHRINLTVEDRHIIKEIILKEAPKVAAQAKAPDKVGEVVPPEVSLHPVPADVSSKVPQVRTHLFFVKNDRVFIVDPKDNRVADVVD